MNSFNVYKHPTLGIEAVKVGFSWPAFFFGIIWMLVKKLWGLAGGWFAMYLALSLIEKITDQSGERGYQALVYPILAAGYFALWLIPAFKGNKWREESLTKRGYEQLSTVHAETPEATVAQVEQTLSPASTLSLMTSSFSNTVPHENKAASRPSTVVDVDRIYAAIANELEGGVADKGLWIRLFAESGGDENQTKVLYIKQRADRLISAERSRLEQAVREEAQRLRVAEEERIRSLSIRERIQQGLIDPQTVVQERGNDVIRYFVKMGADKNVRNLRGQSAIDLAAKMTQDVADILDSP